MIGISTLGMIEKNAKLDPAVIADIEAGTPQGYIHTIGSDGKADAPVAGTSSAAQTDALYIALNTLVGDARYTNAKIAYGDKLESYLLKAWDGQTIWADEDSLVLTGTDHYGTVQPFHTYFVANTDGTFSIVDGTEIDMSNYKVAFLCVRKFSINGKDAVVLKIISGNASNIPTYTVTYDDNGGTGDVPEDIAVYRAYSTVPIDITGETVPTREGYRCVGWSTDDEATSPMSYFTIGPANATLYAVWLPTYTVTYDGNNATSGTAPSDSDAYLEYEDVTVDFTHTLAKTGYAFAGWATTAEATEPEFVDGGVETFAMGDANVTLYAVWVPTYTVTYNGSTPDSGDVPTDTNKYIEGATVTVNFTHTLVKTGFTFTGWAIASDATEPDYVDGGVESFAMGSENVTLYAVWVPTAG